MKVSIEVKTNFITEFEDRMKRADELAKEFSIKFVKGGDAEDRVAAREYLARMDAFQGVITYLNRELDVVSIGKRIS